MLEPQQTGVCRFSMRPPSLLFLDGVYIERCNGSSRFRWVKAPTSRKMTQLAHTIAHRVGRYLEQQGLLERDAENNYLARADEHKKLERLCR